jgi:hypothetical protein
MNRAVRWAVLPARGDLLLVVTPGLASADSARTDRSASRVAQTANAQLSFMASLDRAWAGDHGRKRLRGCAS